MHVPFSLIWSGDRQNRKEDGEESGLRYGVERKIIAIEMGEKIR